MHGCRTPRDKIQCLAAASRSICQALEQYAGGSSRQRGADDLLPCMILLVLRSCPPWFDSDLRFIDTFSDPAALRGEAGYLLTLAASAKSFIERLDASSLSGVSAEAFAAAVAQQEARGAVWETIEVSDEEGLEAEEAGNGMLSDAGDSRSGDEGTQAPRHAAAPEVYHDAWLALYDSPVASRVGEARHQSAADAAGCHMRTEAAACENPRDTALASIQQAFPEVPEQVIALLYAEAHGNAEEVVNSLLRQEVSTVSYHVAPGATCEDLLVSTPQKLDSGTSPNHMKNVPTLLSQPGRVHEFAQEIPCIGGKVLDFASTKEQEAELFAATLTRRSSSIDELRAIFPNLGLDVLECALLSQERSMDRAVEILLSLG